MFLIVALGLIVAPPGSVVLGSSRPVAPADSYRATIVNRVALDIAAPPAVIWSYLPGIRVRPGTERIPLNGLTEQPGARFDVVYKDDKGTITRHDRLELLRWEPGARYVAKVQYLPPGPPLEILYNVDLSVAGPTTRFVMDSYTTVALPAAASEADRAAKEAAQQREWQVAVEKAYEGLKREIEEQAKRMPAQGIDRPAVDLVTHSQVWIDRPAATIWPWILRTEEWKQGATLRHRSGPENGPGEILGAIEPGTTNVAFLVENVELTPPSRRTIKLYTPAGVLIGYAAWTLEERAGRTSVTYDVYSETLLGAAGATMTAEAIGRARDQGYAANKKRFDAELVALKQLVERR